MPDPHENSIPHSLGTATAGSKECTYLSTTKAHILVNGNDADVGFEDTLSDKAPSISSFISRHPSIPHNDRLGWRIYNNRFRNRRSPLPERTLSSQELTSDLDNFAGPRDDSKKPREGNETDPKAKSDSTDTSFQARLLLKLQIMPSMMALSLNCVRHDSFCQVRSMPSKTEQLRRTCA